MILVIRLAHDKFIWNWMVSPVRVVPVVCIGIGGLIFDPKNDWTQAYICVWIMSWIIFLDLYDWLILESPFGLKSFEIDVTKYPGHHGHGHGHSGHGHGSHGAPETEMASHGHG